MKNYFLPIILIVMGIISSCQKSDTSSDAPVVIFLSGDSLVKDSALVKEGTPLTFHIRASCKSALLTNFVISIATDSGSYKIADIGMYKYTLDTVITFIKGKGLKDRWTFFVQDVNRNRAEVSRTIFLDNRIVYGDILFYPSITLTAQDLTDSLHFFSATTGMSFSTVPLINQVDIDFGYYLNNLSCASIPVLAGPSDPGITMFYPFISSWTTINKTLFDTRSINDVTPGAYNAATNDSLLIASYDSVYAFPRYEWLITDLYIPLRIASGKNGIIHIISVDSTAKGSVTFSLKIQK